MAQATYTDPYAPSRRKARQLQEQSAQRIAQRANGGGIADGLAETATQPNSVAATQRAAQSRTGTVSPASLTPEEVDSFNRQSAGRFSQTNPGGVQTRPVQASTLSPAEAASFDAQSGGRFSRQFPSAPTVTNAQARTNAGVTSAPRPGIADDLATAETSAPVQAGRNVAGRVARLGAAPVETVPGRVAPRTAPGQRGGTGAVLASSALLSAADSVTRSTGDYYKRLGLDPKEAGNSVLKDTGVRTAGVLSDLGAGLYDNFVVAPGNALARISQAAGADPNGAFGREAPYLRDQFPDIAEQNAAAQSGGTGGAGAAATAPDFGNVTSGVSSTADARSPAARRAANDGITPVADRTGAADEVLGTFNGRAITRAESDKLAGSQSFGGPTARAATIADGLDSYRPPQGGGGGAQGALIGDGNDGGSKARTKDLNDSSTPAGRLYAQLLQDKTPTGKRVAAQFASEYIGSGAAERGQDIDLQGRQGSDAASLQRGREGDAAQLEGERIRGRNGRQRQYVFNEDGSIGQIADGVLSPVTDQSGKPAKVSVKGKTAGALSLKDREELVTERLKQADPNNELTPDERAAIRQQVLGEIEALSAQLGGQNG